jgi:hypothetical protein
MTTCVCSSSGQHPSCGFSFLQYHRQIGRICDRERVTHAQTMPNRLPKQHEKKSTRESGGGLEQCLLLPSVSTPARRNSQHAR